MQRWMTQTAAWLRQRQCTLVILCHGVDTLRDRLISQHRALYGLSSLRWHQERARYQIAWWCTEGGVAAGQLQVLQPDPEGWTVAAEKTPASPAVMDDERVYLAEKSVLEGAPALSESWRLFNEGRELAEQGASANAATLIFALEASRQVEALARRIHRLRSRRGNVIKIVVREMSPSLRTSDERLLLACGANIIVAHNEPLSRFLSRLESVQGQHFTRHVPEDIDNLLVMMRPLEIKGYLSPEKFTQSVKQLMSNTLIPEGGKGVLIMLHPVTGLRADQALTICNLRRFGDVVTVAQGRLYLFLSTCRINELDTALESIFHLPVNEVFSHRMMWSQDLQILSEIQVLSEINKHGAMSLANNVVRPSPDEPEKERQTLRRQPIAITLLTGE